MAVELATLTGLLERVRSAKEASESLDEAIHGALLADDPWWRAIAEGRQMVGQGRGDEVLDRCNNRLRADSWAMSAKVGRYTESVDAGLGLVSKALPDAYISLSINEAYKGHRLHTAFVRPQGEDEASAFPCATPALAVCAGLLVTLIAHARTQEADHGA